LDEQRRCIERARDEHRGGTAAAARSEREVIMAKVAVLLRPWSAWVRDFAQSGKPIAAVCHGPQLLIEADVVRGKTVTSWPSVKTDLRNAGARWVDQQVVQDGALITSRKPEDLEAFSAALLKAL
jgi:putative intracellular protease/amidase